MSLSDSFLYFAYGSNLLKKRIHINNSSAKFVGIGRLLGHRLDFIKYSENWGGSSATIVPQENYTIWGAVWKINNVDMPALDRQEGVDTNWYFAKNVNIEMENSSPVECRTYQQTINPEYSEVIPMERRPSITYMDCIIKGAIECHLPDEYILKLKKIPNNGQKASPKMIESLNRLN